MSRKKFIAVFTAAALLIWAALGFMLCVFSYYDQAKDLENTVSRRWSAVDRVFSVTETPEEAIRALSLEIGAWPNANCPAVVAAFDGKGNLLAQSHDMLNATLYPTTAYEEEVWVDLDPWMTDEKREAIADFNRKSPLDIHRVKSVAVQKEGDRYIPVYITLEIGYDFGRERTFTFAEAEKPIEIRENFADLILVDVHQDPVLNERLRQMREALPQVGMQIPMVGEFVNLSLKNVASDVRTVKQGEKELYFAMLYTSRPIMRTLDYARVRLVIMTVLFAFAYAVALILLLRLRRSRARLANSRYSFLSAAAHELKTPLAVILGAGECIAENVAPEKTAEYADMILHEGTRMKTLLEQMLRQNRLISAEAVHKERVDLTALLRRETAACEAAAAQKKITLSVDAEEGLWVDCDADMLAVALREYIANALKYAPEGASVSVSAAREKKKIAVRVHNTGSHISPAALPHIWEELYREDSVRGDGAGSGLGLSICRRIFELHRFRYGCASDDTGVTFRFTAPVSRGVRPKGERRLSPNVCAAAAIALVTLGFAVFIFGNMASSTFFFDAGILLACVGTLTGAITLLIALLERLDKKKPRRLWLRILAYVCAVLPILAYFVAYAAGAGGW